MNKVKAFAPATIANLSVGFDTLGLALGSIGDTVEVSWSGSDSNQIVSIENGDNLPKEIQRNCCGVVIEAMQQNSGETRGVDISIHKGFSSGSGMGSSSASSAAAAVAYNHLLGNPYSQKELVAFATLGETAACGTPHCDNVAPAIYGGMVLIRDQHELDILSLPVPESLYALVFFPNVKVNTSDSRSVMSQQISLDTARNQWANLGAFVAGLYQNDLNIIRNSLQDYIAEPVRGVFIPKFQEMKSIANKHNAIGFGISGSGPSVFALTDSMQSAKQINAEFESIFENTNISTSSVIEQLCLNKGALILNS